MAERHLFEWQQSLSIALVAGAVGFVTGLNLPGAFNQSITVSKTSRVQHSSLDSSTSHVKALVAQQSEVYKIVLAKLSLEAKLRRLNAPIPVQFQGKTIRGVQLDDPDKVSVQETQAKRSTSSAIAQPKVNAIASRYPIALTFDDGPWQTSTSQVLDILNKNKVKATFFMVGRQVQKYPQLVKQVVSEGHAIGNHTWNHQYHLFNGSAAAREIEDTSTLIYKTTGIKTSLFRPPAGILTNGLANYAQAKKYAVVMWSVDSRDWRYYGSTAQGLVESVLKDAKPGGIVLLHDGGGDRSKTIQALPSLITQLRQRGYKFVTVPELLESGDKQSKANKG